MNKKSKKEEETSLESKEEIVKLLIRIECFLCSTRYSNEDSILAAHNGTQNDMDQIIDNLCFLRESAIDLQKTVQRLIKELK